MHIIGSVRPDVGVTSLAVHYRGPWRGGEGSGGSRSPPLDPDSRARAVKDPRAQTGPRRICSRAEKWSVEDPASRCSDGRTWSARGWLAVRAGFGCDSLRFSIERPSVFHWIFTTVSCREARRQQLWRSSAGGQHSTPVVDQTGSRPPKRVLKSLFSFCSLHSEACRAREPEAHTHGNEHPHMTSRAQRGGRGEGARIPARPEGGVPLHCNRHFL